MRVVVVVSARPPASVISRARRNIVVVFPPPPTSATTSPPAMPSASRKLNRHASSRGADDARTTRMVTRSGQPATSPRRRPRAPTSRGFERPRQVDDDGEGQAEGQGAEVIPGTAEAATQAAGHAGQPAA